MTVKTCASSERAKDGVGVVGLAAVGMEEQQRGRELRAAATAAAAAATGLLPAAATVAR